MERTIKIFKSFEEQEAYHLDQMRNSSYQSRFETLYKMQHWTKAFHPKKESPRKIIIHKNGYTQ